MKNSKPFFTSDQARIIKKLTLYFFAEQTEVESEAWLVLADLAAEGRDPAELEHVLYSRLRNVHRSTNIYAFLVYRFDLFFTPGDGRGLKEKEEKEDLIKRLPADSAAAQAIELFSGCKTVAEIAEKNNWTRQVARQYVQRALADAEAGYPDDLFAPQRDPDWRPARNFKKAKPLPSPADTDWLDFPAQNEGQHFSDFEAA